MTSARTYAILDVSSAAYDEISAKLKASGYGHAIEDEAIDMHGLALRRLSPGDTDVSALFSRLRSLVVGLSDNLKRVDNELDYVESAIARASGVTWFGGQALRVGAVAAARSQLSQPRPHGPFAAEAQVEHDFGDRLALIILDLLGEKP